AHEVVEAYRYVMQLRLRPALLALSRQALPTFDRRKYAPASGLARGAYVMAEPPRGTPQIILIASGSEDSLAVQAYEALTSQEVRARLVSMPSWDIFDSQPQSYREAGLPRKAKARLAIEQGSVAGWDRSVGPEGRIIGMKTFGSSAPLKELQHKCGFEPDRVVAAAKELLGR